MPPSAVYGQHPLKVGVKNAENTPTFSGRMPPSAVYGQSPLKVGVKNAESTPTSMQKLIQNPGRNQKLNQNLI